MVTLTVLRYGSEESNYQTQSYSLCTFPEVFLRFLGTRTFLYTTSYFWY